MEPFSIITTPEDLAALRVDAILRPLRLPSSALRKAWTILTMHCPAHAPEAWVIWDPAAVSPEPPKPSSWTSVIPSHRPVTKAHTTLGYAKAAVTRRVFGRSGAAQDMSIQELNPVTGKYDTLFTVPKGTLKSGLLW